MKSTTTITAPFNYLLCIPFIIIVSISHAKAQDYLPEDNLTRHLLRKVKVFVGGGLPLGEFGDNDPLAINAGFAYPGVGAGIDYSAEVVRGIGFSLCGMLNIHGHDESQWKKLIPYFSYDTADRVLLWGLGGLFFDVDLSSTVNFYGTSQMGALYVNYPELTVKDVFGEQLAIEAQPALTAGYKIGLGAVIRKLDIEMSFLYGNPEFEPTYKLILGRVAGEFLPERKPVRVLQFTFGYILN